jgi:hypothetical protein
VLTNTWYALLYLNLNGILLKKINGELIMRIAEMSKRRPRKNILIASPKPSDEK